MPRPRLIDDGSTVTLDLHGVTVEEALRLVRATANLATARGRSALRVIHGASTSDPRTRNRTIKHAIHDLLDEEGLPGAHDAVRSDGVTLIAEPCRLSSCSAEIELPNRGRVA